ncbi:hypothetical protein LINPERPRIM_LOCUS2584 [Linum perenne]
MENEGLPDHIIHEILSFLDTEFVVRTSLLSRNLHNTWKEVKNLCFNNHIFLEHVSFQHFVAMLLSHCHQVILCEIRVIYHKAQEYKFLITQCPAPLDGSSLWFWPF